MRRAAVKLSLLLGVGTLAVGLAAPAGAYVVKIGPHQHFVGEVNPAGPQPALAVVTAPPVIKMVCLGPITPGETGHPLAGQTVEVELSGVTSTAAKTGDTGTDTEIGAFFNVAPPASPAASSDVVFTAFNQPEAIPTTLTLPCSGTGNVYFLPLPLGGGTGYTLKVAFGSVTAGVAPAAGVALSRR